MPFYATWLADELRGAGLHVVEHDGWRTRGHYGGFTDLRAVVWHHDASAVGPSPGVPKFMLDHWDINAAQLWVTLTGVWHVLAAGPAYHAGRVLAGKPGNRNSLGIETDHTTGEAWPEAQLASLRIGTGAILRKLAVQPDPGLEFHKTICDPVGRKPDPDGLVLRSERAVVSLLMHPASTGGGGKIPGAAAPVGAPRPKPAVPAPKPKPLPTPLLKSGDSGPAVTAMQTLLRKHGRPVVVDGKFGPRTKRQVVIFQRSRHLVPDGIVGPRTWAALRA